MCSFIVLFCNPKGAGEVEAYLVAVHHARLLVHGAAGARWTVQAVVLPRQAQGISTRS